jgi:serine/threonine-protein kinase SRPK3
MTFNFNCEDPEEYRVGDYHSVELGEIVGEGYEILHKVGFGGTATVWLARDREENRNVAVKIMTARHSLDSGERECAAYEHLQNTLPTDKRHLIVPMYDSFHSESVNGVHMCLILGLSLVGS